MSERKRAKASSPSSPLATIDDIQKRLIRPSSTFSPPSISTPPDDRRAPIKKQWSQSKLRKTNCKLEDYLDLDLLGEVCLKIGGAMKAETTSVKKEVGDFKWPVNELKVLVVESEKGALNLGDDVDLSDEFGDGDGDGDGESSTAFRRFERSALRRFRRERLHCLIRVSKRSEARELLICSCGGETKFAEEEIEGQSND